MQRFWFLFIFISAFCAKAQMNSRIYGDGDLIRQKVFKDSLQLSREVNSQIENWIADGFYFAGIDSISNAVGEVRVYLHQGDRFQLTVPELRGRSVQKELRRKVRGYANNGYPFATARIDSLNVRKDELFARLNVDPGPEITYDSAFFFEPVGTRPGYIFQLLDIVPDDRFREDSYRSIGKKLGRSSFLEFRRPVDISFKSNRAVVFLDLEENPTGSFQGVLGLQQVAGGQTSAVGSLDLNLENLFRSGKQLNIFWERFSEQSQHLLVKYKHPFFLGSKVSPSLNFDLLKQDTSFLTLTAAIGLFTYISPGTELLVEYESVSGTLLTTDQEVISRDGLADFTRRLYKLQLQNGFRSSLGRRVNDWVWQGNISLGSKVVNRNLSLATSFYDTIQISTDFYRLEGMLAYQRQLLRRQSIFQEVSIGWVENPELLNNELYRIGGLNSLRGFNEKQLFAGRYLLSRMEFRSYFEEQSYFFLFYDQLIYSREQFSDHPFGFGLGFALKTSSGQFTFAMGGGKSKNQDLSFSSLKAHFGYLSRF